MGKTTEDRGYSIIVPVKELNHYLLESVPITLALDYEAFEIIILPNEVPETVPEVYRDPRVRIIPTGRVSPALKRDEGARHARYPRLAFLDDDAYPARDWLKAADQAFDRSDADCLGGPAITPKSNSPSQIASGLFFETIVGGGGMAYRYKPARTCFFVDDYPTVNMIVSKKAFDAVGGFGNAFWPGEDTKFCLDLVQHRFKIYYDKDLIVWHHRRQLFGPHLKQVGSYGKHRGHFARIFPETSRRWTYFMPSLFLLGNLGLAILSLLNEAFLMLWFALLAIYLVISTIDVSMRTRHPIIGLMTVATIFLSHLTYGFRFIQGFFTRRLQSELR